MNQTTNRRPIAVDLFAGAGGMSLGFEQAGFDVLAAVEINPIHCATYEYNFPFWTIICRSVADIRGEEIRQLSALKNQEIDVVFGGPPCQGFSLMGKRLIDDPRNELIFHFLRLVLELNPKYFVMENVPGLALGQHKQFLDRIILEFNQKGYKIDNNYQILNAANYGVPQNRKRLFLLGGKKNLPPLKYPEAISDKKTTVWEAIQDLPEVNDYPDLETRDWVIVEYGDKSEYAQKLRDNYALKTDYAYRREYDFNRLTSSLRTKHTPQSIERFAKTPRGKVEKISHFYRLSPDGLCNTLRAGTDHNKGAYTSPRPIHPFTPRCITVREAARLHSYPDWFRFHVTKWHGFRQVGNSVPPLLAKAIAQEIINTLEIQPVKPTEIKQLGKEEWLQFNISQAAQYYQLDPKQFAVHQRR
ncbi:DNA cytosine methyltransferase [Gloeothece citriformis]|nr:DNA cytosine methyltransferase [Gloeothece citriformis]